MNKYYKVVNCACPFAIKYNIKRLDAISNGEVFVAKPAQYSSGRFLDTQAARVLNFSDCAFDAMLWYDVLNSIRWDLVLPEYWEQTYIYEITPLSPIIKERCCDEYGLFQCGATTIRFGDKVPLEQMISNALDEYNHTKLKKYLQHIAYNWSFVKKNIKQWQEKQL
jgi:hypothetical protein